MDAKKKLNTINPTADLHKKLEGYPKKGIFSSFIPKPKNIRFETQEELEKVLLLLRRHVITNAPWILTAIVLVIIPFFYSFFPFLDFLPARYFPFLIVGWYLLIVGFVFEKFLLWFYNIYIVTDERIIDVDFYHILYKVISDAKIDKIQDVSYEQKGIFQAFFNYGDILIQTAAEKTQFVFESIPNPDEVVTVINFLIAEEEQEVIEGRIR